jgi:hypothetical protein
MWQGVKNVLGSGAPLIGGLIGGKSGEMVGRLLSSALGVENSPGAVESELKSNPDAFLKIKQMELDNQVELKRLMFQHAELESEEQKIAIVNQNATMQAEIASNDAFVRRWRPTFGYSVCLAWVMLFFGVAFVMIFKPSQAADVVSAVVALTPLFGIALTVLGVGIHKRSQDKQVSAGLAPKGIIGGIKSIVKGR